MRRTLAIAVLLAALAALPGTAPASSAGIGARIVGGSPAAAGAWPSFAQLTVRVGASNYQCGGSLIAPTVVLTAAHCVNGATAGSSTARIGISTIDTGTAIPWARVVQHPLFDPETLDYDIALVHLAAASPATTMSMLPPSADALLTPGTLLDVAGFGRTSTGGSISNTLLEVAVPLVADATCRGNYTGAGYFYDTARMICAGTSSTDSCNGDSGGALTVETGGVAYAAGLVSWGSDFGCAVAGFPGVYTRVSAFRPWAAVQLAAPTITAVRNAGSAVTVDWSHGSPAPAHVVLTFDVIAGTARTTVDSSASSAQLTAAAGGPLPVSVTARSGAESTAATWSGTPTPTRAPIVSTAISGTAQAGRTLTAVGASDDPWGSAPSFRWTANGAVIPDATGSTYTIPWTRAGQRIGLTTSAANTAGSGEAVASTDVVTATPKFTRSIVRTRGVRAIGATLGVTAPGIRAYPKAKVTYQWLRNGKAIKGRTKRTYVVAKADRGKKLTCRITARNSLGTTRITSRAARIPA